MCSPVAHGKATPQSSVLSQGGVVVQFASSTVRSKKGPRVLVTAAQLIYTKQRAALPVITTAAVYL